MDTLLFAVRPVAGGTPACAVTGTAAEFRAWLEGVVTADDVTGQDVPSLEADRTLPLDLLDRIGASLSVSVRTEAMLLGDRIPASRVELTPVQRLRVLLADPSHGAGTTALPMGPLAAAAARGLGVTVAVVGPDDEVTYHGGHGDGGPAALLVLAGDRHLAGVPDSSSAGASDAPGRGAADASPAPGQGTADAPETPGGPFADDAARLDQVVEALSSAPASVLRPAPAGPGETALPGSGRRRLPSRPGPDRRTPGRTPGRGGTAPSWTTPCAC